MKNTLFALFLLFTNILFAQEDFSQKVAYKLLEYSKKNPIKKVFLHLDDATYQAGEAIFFKAQSFEGIKNLPDTLDNTLICELLDEYTKQIIIKEFFTLKNGSYEGYLQIPDTIIIGNYIFKAYAIAAERKKVDLDYSFYQKLKIKNPNKSIFQQEEINDFELQFFPEGGQIIQDVQMKIAFKTLSNYRDYTGFQGFILGEKGDTITNFTSEKFGMGFFRLKAKANEKYKALVTLNRKTKYFPLPKTEDSGHVLSIDNLTSAETVGLNIKSKLPESELNKPMMVVAQSRGNFLFLGRFTTSNSKTVMAIPKAMFPDGIIHFTIFDEKGTPFSERIIYNNTPNLLNINLLVKENDTLLINVSDRDGKPTDANLSLVVRDSSEITSDFSTQKIDVYLPLLSDLKNRVEAPEYYFDRTNKNAQKDLDVLMMTEKWERFAWKDVLKDNILLQNAAQEPYPSKKQDLDKKSKIFFWRPTIMVKNGLAKVLLPNTKKVKTLHFFVQGNNEKGAIGVEEIIYKK